MSRPTPTRAKHPDFERTFAQWHKLLWKLAGNAAQRFGGTRDDYMGTLVLRLNSVLYTYDPTRAKFNTYFMQRWNSYIWDEFLRYETESHNLHYDHCQRSTHGYVEEERYAYGGVVSGSGKGCFDPINPHTLPDATVKPFEAFQGAFEKKGKLWHYLTSMLDKRTLDILCKRYVLGMNLREIGDSLVPPITKERVRQLQNKGLIRIAKHLRRDRRADALFANKRHVI